MATEMLASFEREKNNWAANVSGVIGAGSAGAALGFPVCGVACGSIGVKTGVTLWTWATGVTGGF
ncbi:bacteriocin [Streptococcus equi subsp. zooepidemicus]|uniref:bacteriocin n=1 Tax=Streptococcus equi TaxID=1336 RepID=UPI0024A98003|nr:bacteriocin [Streptococcus equi]MDI6044571.1 bacteriocin [Streptococcus equi subsp. zooepidemicus]HEK9098371.1 bacteriocin [Streptococcus equi subsp. zooepidemicus]HEL0024448.1 bacteriocin [Streptococcus equi subsp. zooepidemicus]HEL1074145.1 bacteriocin [Streptococcus equi subsp. zooepidemicus]HEL1117814.1 bacteriocin [Streptococcus equi subsp. zooepidemicus]